MIRAFLFAVLAALVAVPTHAASFADWAAVVIAGDHRAHDGTEAEVFDNGRRDVAAALAAIGFSQDNIQQFSVEPDRHPGTRQTSQGEISQSLYGLTDQASGGCLAYFTSHGNGDGIVLGNEMLAPRKLGLIISNACGDRPTVIIVSACFSGTFINQYAPQLQAPNRFVLTAARTDRTSFGCGNTDKYTFFDQCVVESFPLVGSFPDLARVVQQCVSSRERKEGVTYPSEPQVFIGANILAQLPRWR
jgi:hypothetical protein